MNGQKKPTGEIGMTHLALGGDTPGAEFQPVVFPRMKAEIENYIVKRFLAQAIGTQVFPYFVRSVQQNSEADLDFTLSCFDKGRKLEVMEIAPLEHVRGSYAEAPKSYNSYEFARYAMEKAQAKSAKYGWPRNTEFHLLMYVTDWRFMISTATTSLLEFWFDMRPHNFTGIYLYLPIGQEAGQGILLFPTRRDWRGFDPESLKDNVVHNLDPMGWQPIGVGNDL